jgi:uncharacterized protein (TIGR02246 family)
MSSRRALRVVPLAVVILAGSVAARNGWAWPGPARPVAATGPGTGQEAPPAAAASAGRSADVSAIRAADDGFIAEYNKADVKALVARFTDDAEIVEDTGEAYQGRAAIEKSLTESFAASKGARLALEVGSLRFLSADVAKEEGRSIVTPVSGAPVSRLYTALLVKRDGRWLLASVREEPDPAVRPHDRLKALEWMVGDWMDEGSDAVVRVNCRWSDDGNYLMRSFTVRREGKPVMTVSQRVGWDPLAKQFRSWEFDSEGGFGEGRWSRDGNRWVVKRTGVRPDGSTASSTNVMTVVRPDMVQWTSTDRVVGDDSAAENQAFVLIRIPPVPRVQNPVQPAPQPASVRRPQ